MSHRSLWTISEPNDTQTIARRFSHIHEKRVFPGLRGAFYGRDASQRHRSGTKKSTMALLRKRSIKKDGRAHLCGRRGRGSCVQASQGGINHQSAGEALRFLDPGSQHAARVLVDGRRHLSRVHHDGRARGPRDADAVFHVVDEHLQLAPVRKSNFSAPLVGAMASSFHATDAELPA